MNDLLTIQDQGSRNGTRLLGERIGSLSLLPGQDIVIEICDYRLKVSAPDKP
jgi:pSer/pThr/pTyr-binding forkhead associated (FHA) protein